MKKKKRDPGQDGVDWFVGCAVYFVLLSCFYGGIFFPGKKHEPVLWALGTIAAGHVLVHEHNKRL